MMVRDEVRRLERARWRSDGGADCGAMGWLMAVCEPERGVEREWRWLTSDFI